MIKKREIDCDEVIQIKRKNKQIEKELIVEKRLRLEEKQSKEECEAEIDELMAENSDIKKKLTRYRHDLEQLQDENRSLVADYNSMMDRGDAREAEQQIALLQQLMEERLSEETADFAREIERYQQDSEEFKIRFEQTAAELEKTRSELEGAVLYRQDDIDRLLQEKQNLKLELKAKKTKLKSLEATNEKLTIQINDKERQLAKQHATKSKDDNKSETEGQLYEKRKEIEQLQNKVVELETSLTSKNTQFKEENMKLKEALQQLQMTQVKLTRSQSDEDLATQNEELRRNLHQAQKQLLEEQKRLKEVMTSLEDEKEAFLSTFEEEKADLNEKLDKVLEANVDFEKNCIQLETTLQEKEMKITALQQALKDVEAKNKDILFEENKAVKNSLATSQKEVNILKEQIARLEENLDVKQQEATSQLKNFKKEIQALDEEKITAKSQVSELMSKIEQINADFYAKEEKFQTETRMINVQLQQAKEQEKSLADANIALKAQIANQIDIEANLEKKIQNLTDANRELETANSTIANLEGIKKGLESSCVDLKAELKSKEEEIKQAEAKQDHLFNEIKERENLCGRLEAKLLKVEEQLKESIENAEQKILNQNSPAEDKGQSELKIAELTKTKESLEIENKMMKEQIVNIEKQKMSQERDAYEKEKELMGKIQELSKTNEEVLKREKQVVMQNHEMKKTLDAKNLLQTSLEDEMKCLSSKLESKEKEQAETTSAMGALHKENEDWQRKFDDLASTLADTEANIQVLAKRSTGNEKELKAQNRALKQEIEAAKSDLEVKNTELVLMAKKVDSGELLSKTISEKSAEIKAKDRYIEELDQENRKLITETRKFGSVVNELEEKVEKLEFEYDGCKEEKEIYEKELEKQKVNNHYLKNTAKDLAKARENIQELTAKNNELLLKCEQLQAKLDQGKKPEAIQNKR
ncbi:synaptonemal complex protein 1-like [Rhopilema esculentum]|uniref:synaptonemal complex protein 1-like n=1 Tax=Rhopilema esculentum TaxID=499914 RepID=UPI0031DB7816